MASNEKYLMHGPHFAKKYVSDYLQNDLPKRVIRYRNGWDISDAELPMPLKFLTYEPLALDAWPTIITVAISTSRFERMGFDGPDPLYRVNYVMRTYVWCRAVGPDEATIARDRLTSVVRSALLDYPCLQAVDPRQSFQVMIDEGSMREEFSEITLLKGDRVMAGSYIGYDLGINEVVTRQDIGEVSEIELAVSQQGITDSDLSASTWTDVHTID
jgi:hypothetical protein